MTHVPQPGARYVVQGTLKHGRATRTLEEQEAAQKFAGESAGEFHHGDDFFSMDPDLLVQLHTAGAIRLPSEVEDPEVVAARVKGVEEENAALKAELAKLKDAQGAPKSGKSARALNEAREAAAETAAESSEEEASSEEK